MFGRESSGAFCTTSRIAVLFALYAENVKREVLPSGMRVDVALVPCSIVLALNARHAEK